jgi:hypothetical protein
MPSALHQALLWPNPARAPSGVGLMFHFNNSGNLGEESSGYPPANILPQTAPYVQMNSLSPKFGGGALSVYSSKSMFDSGGPIVTGYITVTATGSRLQLSTVANPDNWCIECWLKTTVTPQWALIWCYGSYGVDVVGGDAWVNLELYLGTLYFQLGGNSTTPLVTVTCPTALPSDGTWHHVACVRNGNSYTIYYDGIGTTTVSLAWNNGVVISTPYGLHIGCGNLASSPQPAGFNNVYYPYFGDMDDFRLTAGNSVYTTNFTPTGPLLP